MILLKSGKVLCGNNLANMDVLVDNGIIVKLAKSIDVSLLYEVYDCGGCWITMGGIDVHAHLREPGYEYKETILTGARSAAKGGITSLMSMPNLNPCPDTPDNLLIQLKILKSDAMVKVYPFASLTAGQKGEKLCCLKELMPLVKGFSDDGRCVNNLKLLEEGMKIIKQYGGVIASHAEAEGYSQAEAESVAVERETELAIKTGCKYHFCHLSTQKSFDIVRAAKKAGADITCEVLPHHLFLDENNIKGNTNAKMSPPLRSVQDKHATLCALLDGTADMIATDHAPHSVADKSVPFDLAPNGIIGFETLMPLVYTGLVKTGLATYNDMQNWVTANPATRFGIPYSTISKNSVADIAVLNIDNANLYSNTDTLSKSSNTPFYGSKLYGINVLTLADGKVVYDNNRRIQ